MNVFKMITSSNILFTIIGYKMDGLLLKVMADIFVVVVVLFSAFCNCRIVSIFHDGCGANRIYCFLGGGRSNRHLMRGFRRWIPSDSRNISANNRPTLPFVGGSYPACRNGFSSVELMDPRVVRRPASLPRSHHLI